ncbi:hypothetical protein H6503_01715 [Candidatus Woesearchaeota archaeon]|nr:hypothetical protein [Candidatus Woesearchaeota archaeon]
MNGKKLIDAINSKINIRAHINGTKAMMASQIFVYSLSLVIVSIIVIFGYTTITEFIEGSNDVELLQFQKAFESDVDSYSAEFGSVKYLPLAAPNSVRMMCLTDYYSLNTNLRNCNGSTDQPNPIIKDSYGMNPAREKKNMYLLDSNGNLIDSYYLGNVSVLPQSGGPAACNYLCIRSIRGVFNIRIEGKGVGVEISDAS